jgi:spore germination cell wall hydrolase CwlJ-like protein
VADVKGLIALLVGMVCVNAQGQLAVDPTAVRFDALPAAVIAQSSDTTAIDCLALNIYHEARGEPLEGLLAVAAVTLNRVWHKRFPNSICEVVWQPRQFSWTHDGKSDWPENPAAWERAQRIARLTFLLERVDTVGDATHFHATYSRTPYWARSFEKGRTIGRDVFYKG